MGFSAAGQVLIARMIGANERHRLGRFVGTMSGFLFVAVMLVSVLGIIFREPLLTLMNTPEEAYNGALVYSTTCMIGLVFIYGYNAVAAILRGMGDSTHPLIFIAVAAVINLILDVLFVPILGLETLGAALATVISQAISFILCLLFLIRRRREFSLDMTKRDFLHWDRQMLLDFVKLGSPMAIKFASVHVSKLFVNAFINSYGIAVSAFAGIANKLASIVNLFSNAMNTAGSTMVGQNIVAGEFGRVKKILFNILIITMIFAAVFSVTIALFPEEVFSLFTDNASDAVLAFARPYVPIAFLLFLGSSLRSTMNALINGSGNAKINFVTAILDGIVLRIGLAVLFGLVLDMKHTGFWLGDALAGFTPFWVGIVFFFTGLWKKSAKVKREE